MKLLDQRQIARKIQRLAYEILEQHFDEPTIILAGINNNGTAFAKMLHKKLQSLTEMPIVLTRIRLSPANPLESEVTLEMPLEEMKDKVIIVVDDVANTGRTIFYACKPLMNILPKIVEVAVLVDRKHKSFPIKVDYVGLSLATTLQDDIDVQINKAKDAAVYLN